MSLFHLRFVINGMFFNFEIIVNFSFNGGDVPRSPSYGVCTVNSEIFARVLFSRNFAYAEFRDNKTLAK